MKRLQVLAPLVAAICLVSAAAIAQTTTPSRPRTAPTIKNGTGATDTTKPPVLADRAVKPGDQTSTPATGQPTPAATADDDVIKVETNLVTTPVTVMDRNGRFIPGLTKKSFKISENGVPQKITYFQSEEQPFTVVLVIDTSPSTRYKIDEIHFAALTLVNQLRPNDKVLVVSFDQRVKLLTPEPTSEKQKIYAAIYKSQFGSGTSLYDAVDAVVTLDLKNAPGRKAVVLFTDGVDTTSRRSDLAASLASVEENESIFYPIRYNTEERSSRNGNNVPSPAIDLSALMAQLPPGMAISPDVLARAGRGRSNGEYERGRQYLETLATNTGGRIFEADTIQNLEAAFSGIAEELRRQYTVGYYPDDTGKPGERRKIKIEVAVPKSVVRAKTSYVIAGEEPAAGTQGN
jgi:VWFA-related protein